MKKAYFIIIATIICVTTYGQENTKSVVYGERDSILESSGSNFHRVYIDKNGDYYPDYFISDSELRESNSEIFTWSNEHEDTFITIGKLYSLTFDAFTKANFDKLQESIIIKLTNDINAQSINFESISILIHGFRKPFKTRKQNRDSWSFDDNKTVKEVMNGALNRSFFIEVYWDGAYDCCITKHMKKNKTIFKLFEGYASLNAVKTGYSLRRVVSNLNSNTLNVVSHSTGAIVSSTLLFNAYSDKINSNIELTPTPSQKNVNHCLLAPAISKAPFDFYYNRNTALHYKEQDNYTLSVVYNEKDFVLLKKEPILLLIGPGSKKYGNTTLGCNHKKEIEKLKQTFENEYSNSSITTYKIGPLKNHLFTYYASAQAKAFIKWLEIIK